jgi:hypothetical protein
MMEREDFYFIGGFVLCVFVVVGGCIAFANKMQGIGCREQAELMGLEYRYSFNTTCNVKVNGRWEPLNWQRSVRIKQDL